MRSRRFHRLSELAVEIGEPVPTAGNRPIRLDDPSVAWFVERGELDVFLFEYQDKELSSNAKHLLRAVEGRLVFGVGENGSLITIAKGTPDCQLRRLQLEDILQYDIAEQLAGQVDAWLAEFAAAVALHIEPRPRPDVLLNPKDPGEPLDAAIGCVLSARSGGVVWVGHWNRRCSIFGYRRARQGRQRFRPTHRRYVAHAAELGSCQ